MSDQKTVTEMFDDISPRYDFLNHFLSLHIDKSWRRKTSRMVAKRHPKTILDVATGTADLAIRMARDIPLASIIGIDLSEKMLNVGKEKILKKQLEERIHLSVCDAAQIPFADDSFDAVTVAFGVRNFADREVGLREMARVCRNDGLIAILEFSHPRNPLIATPYRWYSKAILPRLGRLVSRHPSAYHYLPSSVEAFPAAEDFIKTLSQVGLSDIQATTLSGGIATLYYGVITKNAIKPQ